jgi:hypothetical protein
VLDNDGHFGHSARVGGHQLGEVTFAESVRMPRRLSVLLSVLLAAATTFLVWQLTSGVWIAILPIAGFLYAWVSVVWWLQVQTCVDALALKRRVRIDPLIRAVGGQRMAQVANAQQVALTDIVRTSVQPVGRWRGYTVVVVSLRDGSKLNLLTKRPSEFVAAVTPSTTPPDLEA